MHTSTSTQILGSIVKTGKIYCSRIMITLAVIFSFFTVKVNAQYSTAFYTFSTNTTGSLVLDNNGNPINIASGATTLVGSGSDQGVSAVTNIGFSFNLAGYAFTQFSASANGVLQLGNGTLPTTQYVASGGSPAAPLLGAITADMATASTTDGGGVFSKVVGTAPNRCLVVQWVDYLYWLNSSPAATWQVRLYESGLIEFVYGSMVQGSSTYSSGYTTGFSIGTSANTLASITTSTNTSGTTTFATNSYSAAVAVPNLNSSADGSRRVYRYTPPPPCVAPADQPTALTFGTPTFSSVTGSFTAAGSAPTGYLVVRYPSAAAVTNPADGTNYNPGQSLGLGTIVSVGTGSTFTAGGLVAGSSYNFYVYSYNNSGCSGGPLFMTASPLTGNVTTPSGTLSGTKTVGTGGNYNNLTTAFADINANGLSGNVDLQLIAGYPVLPETYPIVSSTAGAAGPFTIHLYPTLPATLITSASSVGTLNLNGAANLVIDGRINGVGSSIGLEISNLSTGYAVQFINDTRNNTVKYCDIKSANTTATSGTIVFSTSAGLITGNDGNVIDNCTIHEATATFPLNAIYSAGTSTALDNSGNSLTNNNIYNYFGAATASNGIYIAANSSAWSITGNKFYQEATRTATTGTVNHAILILTAGGGGYTINNNIIGYANASATGTTTYTGTTSRFIAIEVTAANTPVCNIQGNTVSNISVTSTSAGTATAPVFGGILMQAGSFNVGTATANLIGAATGTGAITVTGSTNGFYVDGIYAASTGTTSIINNKVGAINAAGSAAGIGTQFYGIWALGSGGNFTINGNIVGSTTTANSIVIGTDGVTTVNTANMSFYGIRCDGTGAIIVGAAGVGNTVQNVALRSSGSAAFYGYYNGGAATSANYSYNTLANISQGYTTTSASGSFYGLYQASTISGTLNILNNNFQNLSNLNVTGTIYVMYCSSSTNTANFQNNLIDNITRPATAASGLMYVFYNGGGPSGIQTFSNNTITNITAGPSSGSSTFYAEYNGSSSSSTWNVYNNTVSSVTSGSGGVYGLYNIYGNLSCYNNNINTISTSGSIYGLYVGGSVSTGGAVYLNTIRSLTSSGASSAIYALYTAGTTPTIYKNKIYDISSTGVSGVTYGIFTGGGTTVTIYNNLIGDLRAPSSSLTAPAPSVAGLYISSGTTINSYYNTINLNATSTGPNFGTAAVYSSATPTTITLRNNIFNNTSTSAGTGKTISYQRSAAALTNFGTASNNNDLYAGTPGASNLIYFDGTNSDQTLTAYKTRVTPRESSSITDNPPFISTVGANVGFLHINTAVPTQLEGTGSSIASFTDDYDGDSRNATTPDIGADEFAGTAVIVATINSVAISPTGNLCVAAGRTVTANITAGNTNITSVTLNYSFNGGAPVSVLMTGGAVSAGTTSTWTGSIPVASPTNASVTWSVNVTDDVTTKSTSGTPYADEFLTAVTLTAVAAPVSTCSGAPVTLSLNNAVPNPVYCTPTYTATSASGDFISNFSFAGINNTTGDAPNDYTYYSALTASVVANGTTQYPVSLQAGGTASLYAQQFRIWIDFNRNGTFESDESVFNTTSSVFGATLATGVITIPATVLTGTTRMRVMSKYSSAPLATEACAVASNYGEAEDYNITITGGASLVWSDGTSTVGNTNPVIINPTTTTTYTATYTALGCSRNSNPVTVTVNALPASPTVNNSTQCGTGVPQAFVGSGFNSGVVTGFRWYDAQTGGTLIQSSGATYNGTISTTTSFWVSETNGTCESPRVQLIAAVNTPDLILAAVDNNSVCLNTAISLSATKTTNTNNNTYAYSWTASPVAGSGISSSTPGNPLSITPTAAGTYIYTSTATDATQGCVTTATISVTVKSLPVIGSVTANPATVCAGASSTLTATSNTINSGVVTLGSGTTTYGTSAFPAVPYAQYDEGGNSEILVRASELTALGLTAGNLTSLAFNVSSLNSSGVHKGFTIKIKQTTLTALTGFDLTGMTTVFGPVDYQPTSGINTHSFATAFNWNGSSNILVDICFDNEPTATGGTNYSNNALNTYTTTSYNSIVYYNADGVGAVRDICGAPTGSNLGTSRPNMTFGGKVVTQGQTNLTWTWNPGSLPGMTVAVNPTTTTIYTVTALDLATTCSNTANVTVTVNPLPAAPSGTDGTGQCGTGLTDASVSSNNSVDPQSPPYFKWYLIPAGGTATQSGTSTTYNTPITGTTEFYVSEVSISGCEGPRVHLTSAFSDPDPITVSATSRKICLGQSTDITSTYTPELNSFSIYSLTANSTGSGVIGTISLTPNAGGNGADNYTVTPTAAGTYIYTISANDPDKGCTALDTVLVSVSANPVVTSAVATPSTVCAGSNVTLTAQSVAAASGTATVGTQSTTDITGSPWRGGACTANKVQYLILASELNAAGIQAGPLTSIAFNITSAGSIVNNFTIALGTTASTTLTSTFNPAALTTVYSAASFTPSAGSFVPLPFSAAYSWDGTSNLLISICHDYACNTSATVALYTAPANLTTYLTSGSSGSNCSSTGTATPQANRPVMKFGAQVGTNLTGTLNWVWNPGNIPAGTSGIANVTPLITTTYTATATNSSTGCYATSSPVTVTVNPIPAAPVSSGNITRCGPGTVTATVSGSGGTFIWYDAATGGNILQTGGATYTTNISTSSSFWVSETSAAGCTSSRTQIMASFTPAPVLTISAGGATTFCEGGSVQLTAGGAQSYTNFAWSSTPSTGGGLNTTTGSTVTATPTLPGSIVYTLTADDGITNGCANVETITLTVNAKPVISSATANPTTSCAGGAVTLTATTPSTGPGTKSLGTGTSTTLTAGITPYNSNWEGSRTQYLVRASELTAIGLTPGNITSLGFNVTAAGIGTFSQSNFSIKIAHTAQTDVTGGFGTPTGTFVTVLNPTTVAAPNIGVNTFTFDSPFAWDGTSNILIDICHDNDIDNTCASCFSGSSTIAYSTTSYNSVYGSYGDNVQSCGTTSTYTTSTFTSRPNMVIGGQVVTNGAGAFSWLWNPVGISGSTITVNPTVTTTYTVTAKNPTTFCSTTSSGVTVTILPVGASATATPSTPVCAGTSVTLNSVATGGGPFTYSWNNGTTTVGTATASIIVTPAITTTYTVTITDNCNNSATSSVTVTVNPLPAASIAETGPITLCSPATQVLTAVTNTPTASYQWTLNGLNIAGATFATYTVSGVGTGAYRVIVTNTATSCVSAASAPITVTINQSPVPASIAPVTATICAGGTKTLIASGGTTPTSGNATIGTATTRVAAANVPTAFCNYYSQYWNQAVFTATELHAAGIQAGNITSLAYNISTLGDAATNANYSIRIGTTSSTTLSSFTTTGLSLVYGPVTYTHAIGINTLNFTTAYVWDGTSNLIIDVRHDGADLYANARTTYTATTGNTTISAVTSTTSSTTSLQTLVANSTVTPVASTSRLNVILGYNAAVPPTWSWSPASDLNTTTGSTVIASPLITTTYTATATNTNGCTATATSTITVNPRPTGVLSGSGTYCAGQGSTATTLSIAVTGAGPWTGTITDGTTTTPFSGSASPISVSVAPTATTTYTIATLNGSACSSIAADLSGSATVTVNPTPATPTVTSGGPTTFCSGGSVVLTSSSATGNQWNLNGTAIAGATNQTLTVTASGDYTVTVTNGSNCAATSTITTITVNPTPATPTVTAGGPTTFCSGGSVVLTSSSATGNQWNLNGTAIAGATNQTLTVTASGNYTVTVTAGSCSATSAVTTVTVNPTPATPTVTSGGPTTFCSGGSVVLTSSSATGNQWNLNGTAIAGATNQTLTVTASGDYTVTVTNGSNCAATSTITTVTVNPTPATPTVTAGGPTTFCSGGSVVLTSSSATGNQWNLNGTAIAGATNQTLTVTASGDYTVTVTAGTCSATSTVTTVTVNPTPATPTVTAGGQTTFCSGGSVVLTSSSATGNQWNLNGTAIGGATNQTLTVTASGDYTVTVTNGSNCSATSTITTVTVNPTPATPTVTAGGPTTFCQGGSVVLTSSSATGNQWNLNGTAIVGATNQTLTVTASGNYTVTVTAGSCSATSTATTVTVNPLAANVTATVTQPTCTVATGTVTVTAPLGAGITYSLDGGAYQPGTTFSNVAPGTHTLTAQTVSGCFSPASTSVTVNAQPVTPAAPVVSGIVNVCPYLGTGQQLTYTATAAGATGFTWTLPPHVNLVTGQGTSTLVVTFDSALVNQVNKQLRVKAVSSCGSSAIVIFYLTTQIPAAPAPISGIVNICPYIGTGTVVTYTIPSALSATRYLWSVPAGTTVTHPNIVNPADSIYDTVINVVYNAGFVTGGGVSISVTSRNGCGLSGTRTLQLSAQPAATPGLINGPTNVCANILPGGTAATYSVSPVSGAVSYTWTWPSGATVSYPNGQGVNGYTISVLYPQGFNSGTMTVSATNGCGTGGVRSLSVTKLTPSTPSNIDVIQTGFCGDVQGRVYTYTLSSMPANATSVQWTIPATGATFVSGQGTTSITVSYGNGAVNGNITAQAQNNCGVSGTRSVIVKLPVCSAPGFAGKVQVKEVTAQRGSMEVKIFPNPTVSDFKLEVLSSSKEEVEVRVIDVEGRLYKSFKTAANQTISLGAELKAGSYMVEVRQGGELRTTKLVKF